MREVTGAGVGMDDDFYRLPASFGQERLWVLEYLAPEVPLYVHGVVAEIFGTLDVGALTRTLCALIERHEPLRSRFEYEGGRLVQLVSRDPHVDFPVVELDHLPEDERAGEAQKCALELVEEGFDLRRGPLFKAALIRLAPDLHRLVLSIHHTVSDGWSMRVLANELSDMYGALVDGRPPRLEDLEIQYGDYAAWQREWLQGPEFDRQLSYWRKTLDGAPALLDLPTDRPRPPVQTFNGGGVRVHVEASTRDSLAALAERLGATEFMVLLAAFDVLLWRHTGERDLVVATPVAGRTRTELEHLIGFFVNTLLMRVDLSGDPSFFRLAQRVRDAALDAFAHQELPFEKLVEEIDPERDLSHLPLSQVMFVFQSTGKGDLSLPGLDVKPVELPTKTAPFDLTLELFPTDGGYEGSINFNTDLFERATVERMAEHFERILASVARDPGTPISAIQYQSTDEKTQLLHGWYSARPDFLEHETIHEAIASRARRDPDRIAAVSGSLTMTYGELNERANRLANYLLAKGIGPDESVALLLERGPETLVAMLGIWKAGAGYLPLDPENPPERSGAMLDMADVRVMLSRRAFLEQASEISIAGGRQFQTILMDSDWPRIQRSATEDPPPRARGRNLAYTIFTSGSTGVPKGVMLEHAGVVNMAHIGVGMWGIGPESRFCQFMSLTFDASVAEIVPVLVTGASLNFGSREQLLPGPDLIRFVKENRITTLLLTPSALSVMPVEPLPDLQTLILCGEACPPELLARWSFLPRVVNGYGPTEITVTSHAAVVHADGSSPPIGRPHPNTRSYVLDDRLQPVPFNVRGELYVGTIGIARGYLGRPDLTVERFLPDPYSERGGERMYRTGDVVRIRRDGQLDFLGRVDHQVKVRGFRIELAEIEAALVEHPAVDEAAVIAPGAGNTQTTLVAYYSTTGDVGPAELRRSLAARLPAYMIPSVLTRLDEMPHMTSGKIDRSALPTSDVPQIREGKGLVSPTTEMEREVAALWSRVLGVQPIGVEDKFFEIGGNSLRLVELWGELDRAYPGAVKVADLFEHTTVAAIADYLERRTRSIRDETRVAAYEL